MFTLNGYGLTMVDPDGIVRAIDVFPEDAKDVMKEIYKPESS